MPVPEISVARPTVQNITLTKEYPGYLTSEKTVDLVGRVSGTLQTIAYAPGSRVRQGQVLFVIEPTVYQDNVRQAEAELNTARANLEYAQNNYTRMQEAMKSDAVSRIQVLQAQSNVATSQAAVSNAEAALNTARTNLSYCTVRAPFDGTVSRNLVDAGGYVGGSVQPVTLATIYKDDHLYTYFNVADNQWLSMLMQQGDSIPRQVSVSLGKDELLTYPAQLDYLSPNVDLNTGTLNIRARLDNPKGLLQKRPLRQHHLALRRATAGYPAARRLHRYRPVGEIHIRSQRFEYSALPPYRNRTTDRRQPAPDKGRHHSPGALRHQSTDEGKGWNEVQSH